MVAASGVEPPTFRVWTGCSSQLSYPARVNGIQLFFWDGRDDRIWTCDPLVPNQVHYQAVLHPEINGAPSRNRTHNLLIRSQTLYPVELWAHRFSFSIFTLFSSALIYNTTERPFMQDFFWIFFVFFIQMQNSLINKGLVPFSPIAFTPLLQD